MGFSAADVVIPACAVIGIVFAAWQWFLVAKVKVSAYASAVNGGHGQPVFRQESEDHGDSRTGGESDDEEDGGDGPAAVARCAEIQNAISVGEFDSYLSRFSPGAGSSVVEFRMLLLASSCFSVAAARSSPILTFFSKRGDPGLRSCVTVYRKEHLIAHQHICTPVCLIFEQKIALV